MEITTPEQFKALGHSFRQRLLFALGQQPATISQLAKILSARKGNVDHHLKVLRDAGLVRIAETRTVRGGTEHYYQRSSRRIRVLSPEATSTAAMLAAFAQELSIAPVEPLLNLRHLRLTAAQAERLRNALEGLVDTAEDAGDGEPRYGVLVSLYQQP
ncbi:hypothetical protein GCM10009765_16260 [Fodinicola feengrottensis]|uniref:HTH arsR-type domain-containing protein n=2 Tax=Fodinicola feengrottensis TaxID=435914 RepID=A0ABP4S557_9ACTN